MLIPDGNVLLYAVNRDAPPHAACRGWLTGALSGGTTVGFSWNVLLGFVRVSTRPGVFARPLNVGEALDLLETWLDAPASTVIAPGPRHASLLRSLLEPLGTAGNLTSDAHLAALALENGGTIVSCDHDFLRFKGVRHIDPTRR